MTFLTLSQLAQFSRKCSMFDENAKWIDIFDENSPCYCDKHYLFGICECEICKEGFKIDDD